MKASYLLSLTLALAPSLASAAIFPPDTKVKMLDANGFRQAMKQNETSIVAFVAPWCGHCQKMAPEYSKAAGMLTPMVPVYAVDCDAEPNKRLCAEQGVQGFPTLKLFPRGGMSSPVTYEGPRSTKDIYTFASERIPHGVKQFQKLEDVQQWADTTIAKPRAVLLTANTVIPLVWRALGNVFKGQIKFASIRDKDAQMALDMGLISQIPRTMKRISRIAIYPAGSTSYALYDGPQNYRAIAKFMQTLIDGTAHLNFVHEEKTGETDDHESDTSAPAAPPAQEIPASQTPLNVVEVDAVEAAAVEAEAVEVEAVEVEAVEAETIKTEAVTSEEQGAGVADVVEEPVHVDEEPAPAETAAAKAAEATDGSGSAEHVKDEL